MRRIFRLSSVPGKIRRRNTINPEAAEACGDDSPDGRKQQAGGRRRAYEQGVLDGYACGWRDGLRAGAERGTAA